MPLGSSINIIALDVEDDIRLCRLLAVPYRTVPCRAKPADCSNTKQDLGACDYLHDAELKKVRGLVNQG